MTRAPALGLLALAACGCPGVENGRALYAEGVRLKASDPAAARPIFARASERLRDGIAHCGLGGEARLEPLALQAMCSVQLGDVTATRAPLEAAAAELVSIAKHDLPAQDSMLLCLARASYHVAEADRALEGVEEPSSTHAAMLARVAGRELTHAIGLYDAARQAASDPTERQYFRYQGARTQVMKARAHRRAGEEPLVAAALALANSAIESELAAGSAFGPQLVELRGAVEALRRP